MKYVLRALVQDLVHMDETKFFFRSPTFHGIGPKDGSNYIRVQDKCVHEKN